MIKAIGSSTAAYRVNYASPEYAVGSGLDNCMVLDISRHKARASIDLLKEALRIGAIPYAGDEMSLIPMSRTSSSQLVPHGGYKLTSAFYTEFADGVSSNSTVNMISTSDNIVPNARECLRVLLRNLRGMSDFVGPAARMTISFRLESARGQAVDYKLSLGDSGSEVLSGYGLARIQAAPSPLMLEDSHDTPEGRRQASNNRLSQ